jgi:hypothetical protein
MSRRPPGPVLGLLVALLLGLATVIASLTGLLSDARVAGSPRPTYTPPTAPIPDGAAVAADQTAAAWATMAGYAAYDWVGDPGHWQLMADTLAVHWRVLTGPNPLGRDMGETTLGEPPEPSGWAAFEGADQALLALAETQWGQARATVGLESAWWAGLAGATEQVRSGVSGPYPAPHPLNPLATLAEVSEAEAVSQLLAADHAAVYAASAVLGWLPAVSGERAQVQGLLTALRRERDLIRDLAAANGWPTPAAAAAYDLPELTDQTAPIVLGQALDGIAQAAIAWVAATTDYHDRALDEVRWAALIAPGYMTSLWLGWPN